MRQILEKHRTQPESLH